MKKLISIVLVCCLCFLFAACGEDNAEETTATTTTEAAQDEVKLHHEITFGMTYDQVNAQYKTVTGMELPDLTETVEGYDASGYIYNDQKETLQYYGISEETRTYLHTPSQTFLFDKQKALYEYNLTLIPQPALVTGVSEEVVVESVMNDVLERMDELFGKEPVETDMLTLHQLYWKVGNASITLKTTKNENDIFEMMLIVKG